MKTKKYFLFLVIMFFPVFTFAKITCSNGEYNATLDILKTELKLDEQIEILLESEFTYKISYNIENKKIINIEDNTILAKDIGKTNVTAKIEFYEEEEKVSECMSSFDINVLSSDSTLRTLNLEEFDISEMFSSDKYEYEILIPYHHEKINIIAEANDENATITGDGRRYLNEDDNNYEIIVKATDGTTTTYKIKVLREKANEDNKLKSLVIEGYLLEPKFKNDIYEYELNVDENVEKIKINAEANYEFSSVRGIGEFNLATGKNEFPIIVTAENETEQTYKIIINKSKGACQLKSLNIEDFKLDKEFKNDIYLYNLTVGNEITKLDIKATAKENEKIEIFGHENLKVGENNIIIRVSDKNKGATTYKIVVNKLSIEDEEIIEKNDNLLKILFIMFIIAIIIMIIVVSIFLKRNYKDRKKYKQIKFNSKK